ncbi:ABC transporter permease [uncultured Microbacterium sp.]|uniref:ABC transporter permease n=1 Tax=uncultured Microbacterium sp. TaxID=191216 RepID=UPI0037DDBD02
MRSRDTRRRRPVGSWLLPLYVTVAFLVLLIPIIYTFAFSFNAANRSNISWNGFTLENWLTVCAQPDVCVAFGNSLLVGAIATLIATTLGTMIALALVRYRFRARSSISLLLFLPMATPEVVIGAGLASQFLTIGVAKGLVTIIIAHTMFCLSFVVVTVRARVLSLDPALEEAGRDLYGSPREVFWRITFPLLLPGIVAAALLSFSLSFDDFIITYFTSGTVQTFPVYIYVAAQRGIPPQANVIASAVFLIAIAATLIFQVVSARRASRVRR